MAHATTERRVVSPAPNSRARLAELVRYRQLLSNLIGKELKVKYKTSTLGFLWSMLNPALYLVIFWVVFTKFLGGNVPRFPIFLLSGLLGWNLWSGSLGGAVGSMVGNASLVTKVYFPREVLPLSAIGAAVVQFGFQFAVLLAALVVFRVGFVAEALVLVPAGLAVLLLLLVGGCLLVAVANVYFRDVQHLLELLLLAWFWMTPIVYPVAFVADRLGGGLLWKVYMLNPMTSVVLAFQRGVYGRVNPDGVRVLVDAPVWWYLRNLGLVACGGAVLLVVGWLVFQRLESRVAEEL